MQTELEKNDLRRTLPQQRSYAHACELYAIRHLVAGEPEDRLRRFPPPEEASRERRRKRRDPRR